MGIVQWLKRHQSPSIPVFDSVDAIDQFIDSRNITIVGFFEVRPKNPKESHLYVRYQRASALRP